MKNILFVILFGLCPWMASAQDMSPGNSVFGQHNFIEYVPGDLPIIIVAPHGGRLLPPEIPDRRQGVTDSDANTQELARTIAAVIHAETGRHIHLVICRLHRSKLDANREITEAAQGNALAEQAWHEHHAMIEHACAEAVRQHGVAFLIDLHGHGHKEPRVELGYLHTPLEMSDCEEALNGPSYTGAGSLELVAARGGLTYTELLRGPMSFGALLEERGFAATPSPRLPVPDEPYFKGGYTIFRHCDASRHVTGFQIEANRPRLRDTPANRLAFAKALTSSLNTFLSDRLGLRLDGGRANEPAALPAETPSAAQ
ncbi:N-formylglutamate amidohydrolase [Prosthecobacter fusiformis]|uniref:N-formylglutamate amidohydrolase n=1 Tax=Prosthecobacter fusiformis TaxID=48464 RepID=A0A4V3FI23_9BACT|nr:N-formylglutamate amidohydrolase [Prosthecobacter fusiformis]TDU80743.1 N-formylglutamate amidohydrolase [Prosthecobacter fusiformis]